MSKATGNKGLTHAKAAQQDEFYTQFGDIQVEMNAYLDYAPDVFRGKTILLPCDDPEWSNFTKFFILNFKRFGLKKLISTSYAVNSKPFAGVCQPSLFEQNSPQYNPESSLTKGNFSDIFVVEVAFSFSILGHRAGARRAQRFFHPEARRFGTMLPHP